MLSPEPPLLFGFVYFGGEPPLPTYAVGSVHRFDFFHDLLLPYVSALLSEASPHGLLVPRRAPCNIHLVAQLIVFTHKKRRTKLNAFSSSLLLIAA